MQRRFKWFALCSTVLLAFTILAILPLRKAAAQKEPANADKRKCPAPDQFSDSGEESRTFAQKKIDSQLLYAATQKRGEKITNDVGNLEVNVNDDEKDWSVDIRANVSRDLLKSIALLGGEVPILFQPVSQCDCPSATAGSGAACRVGRRQLSFIRQIHARNNRFGGFGSSATADASYPIKVSPLLQSTLRPDFADRALRVRSQIGSALFKRNLRPSTAMFMPTGPVDSQGTRLTALPKLALFWRYWSRDQGRRAFGMALTLWRPSRQRENYRQ